ncbi:hypothetical protein K505DRAFT_326373 [Melanomma pulvis-pyrius CBS 109.77]|uniref:Uncharacterized protein n=1 Tax=Melanomma pulvis-pyrius CBS 109.77 TaxID=1314802 RepID=A0A6A6X789_9PLEO|nr:hypothetical protein K505DRAFT_326373 [Melanomma pulvis-pyrius CBS 109.77]
MTTVVLPVGPLQNGCIGTVNFNTCDNKPEFNATSDYVTICCDGAIINTAWSLWSLSENISGKPWLLNDFACCERDIWDTPDITTCSEGTHQTALASLAGTNTDNFHFWTDTYLTGMAMTPRCAWFGIGAGEVTTVTAAVPTGAPDTTKVIDSSTTWPESGERSSVQSMREMVTDSSSSSARTIAVSTTASTSLGVNAIGSSSISASAQSTSDASRVRMSWGALLAISILLTASAI